MSVRWFKVEGQMIYVGLNGLQFRVGLLRVLPNLV